jgi:uncharacterized protein (TIGR02118 family)
MVKLTVLYGPPEDPAAFEDHYASTHVPLVHKIPGLRRFEATRITATPGGGEPPYFRMAELWFDDAGEMQAALGSDEGRTTVEDIGNFATGGATTIIGEVD